MTDSDNKMLTVGQLCKDRGWTKGLVERHLGEPDETRANPYYRSAGAPMRLYALPRVEAAEHGEAKSALADAEAKRFRRKAAARKAVETKVSALIAEIDQLQIEVVRKPWPELVAEAMQNAYTRDGERRQMRDESDEEFEQRMAWNFARHELTVYNAGLASMWGRVGSRGEAYEHLRERIEEAIMDVYPELNEPAIRP